MSNGFSKDAAMRWYAQWVGSPANLIESFLDDHWFEASNQQLPSEASFHRLFKGLHVWAPEQEVVQAGNKIFVGRSGLLLTEPEFEYVKRVQVALGEDAFFIVENFSISRSDKSRPPVSLRVRSSETWDDLNKGSSVSEALFQHCDGEFFVYGTSGLWGKYVANDSEPAVEILVSSPEVLGYCHQWAVRFMDGYDDPQFLGSLPDHYRIPAQSTLLEAR